MAQSVSNGGLDYGKVELRDGRSVQYAKVVGDYNGLGLVVETRQEQLQDKILKPVELDISKTARTLEQTEQLSLIAKGALETLEKASWQGGTLPIDGDVYSRPLIVLTSSDSTVDPAKMIDVVFEDGAPLTPMTVVVNRLATRDTIRQTFAIDPSAEPDVLSTTLFATADAETLASHGITDGQILNVNGFEIELEASWTLTDLKDVINEALDEQNLSSDVYDTGSGFALGLSGILEGISIVFTSDDPDVLANLGLTSLYRVFQDADTDTLGNRGITDNQVLKIVGSKGTASISLQANWTLTDFLQALNSAKATSGIEASFLAPNDAYYRLSLSDINTGYNITFDDTDDSILEALGLAPSGATTTAEVVVDGLTYTPTTNTVTLDQVGDTVKRSLNLKAADSTVTISLQPTQSYEVLADEMQKIVDSYNKLREVVVFQKSDQLTKNMEEDKRPILKKDPFFLKLQEVVEGLQRAKVSTNPYGYVYMSDIGLDFNPDTRFPNGPHPLTFNRQAFIAKANTNPEAIQKLLRNTQEQTSGNTGNFNLSSIPLSTKALNGKSVTISVEWVAGSHKATISCDGYPSKTVNMTSDGTINVTDGVFKGLTLYYTGNTVTSESMTVEFTRGILGGFYQDLNTLVGPMAEESSRINELQKQKIQLVDKKIAAEKEYDRKITEVIGVINQLASQLMLLASVRTMFAGINGR